LTTHKANDPVREPERQTKKPDELIIERRFQGPPSSGNGGYVCGRLAEYIDGPATVRLLRPPPLDTPMTIVESGTSLELRTGDDVVARAHSARPEVNVPEAPSIELARRGRGAYAGHTRHVFPGCFVCGVERQEGDGLLIHAGSIEASGISGESQHRVACSWAPHQSLCGDGGIVPERYIWAALDCPGGWAFLSFSEDIALLGELTAEILSDVPCGREYIVAGWEIDRQGRKRLTGSALYDSSGTPLAIAEATWIVIDPPKQ